LDEGPLHVPLLSHAHYRREEVRAALGWASMTRKARGHAGGAAPFLCLGLCDYVDHKGERPIAITWHLPRPMPGDTFRVASVVA
jgi:hypothetical protein